MKQIISKILPKWICASEVFGLEQEVASAEEALLVASSIPERRAEFLTGRKYAHVALSDLGVPFKPILHGPNRKPLWPEGVVGSITHCGDYITAAVARSNRDRWIGIDAESNEPIPEGIIDFIASPSEIKLAAGAMKKISNWDRLIFSAKERIYKASCLRHQIQLDVLYLSLKFFQNHLPSISVSFLLILIGIEAQGRCFLVATSSVLT